MEKAGLLDFAIAPLQWLERSKGWQRRGLVVLYLLVILMVGLLSWREISIWKLPNLSEPFDEARLGTVALAESENALPLYLEAVKSLKRFDDAQQKLDLKAWYVTDWEEADPEVQRWVAENRPVLEPWLRATGRAAALLVQPREMKGSTILDGVQKLRELARLATLEGTRLASAGDLEGAWRMYCGVLRSSRHAGQHGGMIQRLIGNAILMKVNAPIGHWIEKPTVTPTLLRRSIQDIEACWAMTAPNSEMVRIEYFVASEMLGRPEEWKRYDVQGPEGEGNWYNQFDSLAKARRFILNEPERSLRIQRLITAGVLAQCDRPRPSRPKLISDRYMVYDIDANTPPAVASLTPQEWVSWADRSAFATVCSSINPVLSRVDFELNIFDSFRLRMAERAFEIERGRPAKTYGELIGNYLKTLPAGIQPEDATAAPGDSK